MNPITFVNNLFRIILLKFIKELNLLIAMIKHNISLKHLNTFGINVNASYFASFGSVEELQKIKKESLFNESKKLILGGGVIFYLAAILRDWC